MRTSQKKCRVAAKSGDGGAEGYIRRPGAHFLRPVTDRTIERRFRRYGSYAGLAFWLYLTRHWVDDGAPV